MTESELINGCIKNDATCQRMLFEQYSGVLMTICIRYASNQPEAEDILQDAFIQIFSHINQYRFEGSFEGWLKRIAINTALKLLKKKVIYFSALENDAAPHLVTEPESWADLSEREILTLVSNLPTGYRIVFNLFVLEGYSHNEIAEMLHISNGTSRSQLAKAKRSLQEQIRSQQKLRIND